MKRYVSRTMNTIEYEVKFIDEKNQSFLTNYYERLSSETTDEIINKLKKEGGKIHLIPYSIKPIGKKVYKIKMEEGEFFDNGEKILIIGNEKEESEE